MGNETMGNKLIDAMDAMQQPPWVDAMSDKLQAAVSAIYQGGGEAGQKVRDVLHGTWLGHPLHAAVTDVPIGAWTTAVVLDALEAATGNEAFGKASEAAIGVGLAGAVVAAASGAADWQYTDGRAKRIGALHALLNIGGTALFASSLLARRNDKPRAGRALAMAGWSGLLVSSYLGGHLAYGEHIGMDHNAPWPGPEEWKPVLPEKQLPDRTPHKVELDGNPILLYRRGDHVAAISERCAHLGGPLSEGEVKDDHVVVCPWHGSHFDLETGNLIHGPSVYPQTCYEARIQQGQVEIRRRTPEGMREAERSKPAAPAEPRISEEGAGPQIPART
ncbi:MAG: Rieske 2Fe-2S domain-containing protein [Candidatus Eisenbacteria bacterium]